MHCIIIHVYYSAGISRAIQILKFIFTYVIYGDSVFSLLKYHIYDANIYMYLTSWNDQQPLSLRTAMGSYFRSNRYKNINFMSYLVQALYILWCLCQITIAGTAISEESYCLMIEFKLFNYGIVNLVNEI